MYTILAARSRPAEMDPAVRTAARLAARTGARVRTVPLREAVHEASPSAGEGGHDRLVVLAPRVPASSGLLELDEPALSVVLHSEAAVLVVRSAEEWSLRRVLVPVERADLERGTLPRAAAWVERLLRCPASTAREPGGVELQVLHVSRDPDEMYTDAPRLRGQLEQLRAGADGIAPLELVQCGRWGASRWRRIALQMARQRPDLVVLPRDEPDRPLASRDPTWLYVLGVAPCPVLLLPLDAGGTARGTDDAGRRVVLARM